MMEFVFLAQQSSKMGVKALCLHFKLECLRHAISRIVNILKEDLAIPENIIFLAKKLDK